MYTYTMRRGNTDFIRLQYQDNVRVAELHVEPDDIVLGDPSAHEFILTPSRAELNTAKTALDKINIGKKEWLAFRSAVDPYFGLRRTFETKYGAKHVTNAYLKYHELLTMYGEFIAEKPILFFNAELPGAAISAVNHYMVNNARDYTWYASSLYGVADDGTTTALDDKYGYLAANPSNWLMNETNNGDMTVADNIIDISRRIGPSSSVGGVHFYSHDAGIDVSDDYNNQESANAKLHFGCAIAGLMTMRRGAVFVAKQYSFYDTFTADALLVYASLFDKFKLVKPMTSRPTNSEIYLVGLGFRGISDVMSAALLDRLRNWSYSPLLPRAALQMPAVSELARFHRIVYGAQIMHLGEMVRLSRLAPAQISRGTANLKRELEANWMRKFPAKPIASKSLIASS